MFVHSTALGSQASRRNLASRRVCETDGHVRPDFFDGEINFSSVSDAVRLNNGAPQLSRHMSNPRLSQRLHGPKMGLKYVSRSYDK